MIKPTHENVARGFTLVELLVVVAAIGAAASLGAFFMSGQVQSAKKQAADFRFSIDLRNQRAENIKNGMQTLVTASPNPQGGTIISFQGATPGGAPCAAVTTTVTMVYEDIVIQPKDAGTMAPLPSACFNVDGQPVNAVNVVAPVDFTVTHGAGSPRHILATYNGGIESEWDQDRTDGVADISLHVNDDMADVSANPVTVPP